MPSNGFIQDVKINTNEINLNYDYSNLAIAIKLHTGINISFGDIYKLEQSCIENLNSSATSESIIEDTDGTIRISIKLDMGSVPDNLGWTLDITRVILT